MSCQDFLNIIQFSSIPDLIIHHLCFYISIYINLNFLTHKALKPNKVPFVYIICYLESILKNFFHSIRHLISIRFKLLVISSAIFYSICISILWPTKYSICIYNYRSIKVCSFNKETYNCFFISPNYASNVHYHDSSDVNTILVIL